MVTMSTVSLSTVARSQMTAASSLYTLSRRISGNIAYAMLATILARRSQVHRSELVGGMRGTNPLFRSTDAQFRSVLSNYGVASTPSRRSDLAMLSQIVNGQATMMAYNDCFWLMAVMLVAVLPFLYLLPKTGVPQEAEAVVE